MTGVLAPITDRQRANLLDPVGSSPPWVISCVNALTQDFRPRLPASHALTGEQRTAVQAMASRLETHLAPASDEEIGSAFAMIRLQFPAKDVGAGAARAVARGFLLALRGAPAFALECAVERILSGQAGINPDFMPTAPRVRQIADEISRPARWHAVQLRRLLEAEIEPEPSPEARERVRAMVAALASSLPASSRDRRQSNPGAPQPAQDEQ